MATTITFNSYAYHTDSTGYRTPVGGSLNEPLTVTLAGDKLHRSNFSVATATTQVILNVGSASTDDISAFAFLYILSTQDVLLEYQGTTAAANGNIKLKANKPFYLFSDDTLAYNAAGGFAGAAQDILKLTVSNSSGSTATVTVEAAL